VERRAPKKAYFELDDHPANLIPYTPKDDSISRYSTPLFKSVYTMPSPLGITAQAIKDRVNVLIGANLNSYGLAVLGTMGSLTNSFSPSAKGVSNP
jgi:hypothetical protein